MSELLPTPKKILAGAVIIIAVFGIAELTGFSGWLTNPISMFRQKFKI
jgi:hypothetical protein